MKEKLFKAFVFLISLPLMAQINTFPIGGGGGGGIPSGSSLPATCSTNSLFIQTGSGLYLCKSTNTWVPVGNSDFPYETSFTATSATILSSAHGKGPFPFARFYAGGVLIPVVYTVNAQGDISVSGLPLDTYTVEVTGSLAYENDYTSVTSISVPNTTHGKGLHPGVQLYLGGQTIPASFNINGSGDVSVSGLVSGNYHIKIF